MLNISSESGASNPFDLGRKALSSAISNIVNVNDKENVGIGGFLVSARVEDNITKKQTLTTNPVENGVNISDHLIKDPLTISIAIDVSDIEIKPNNGVSSIVKRINQALPNVTTFLPKRTATQLTKVNNLVLQVNDQIQKIDEVLKNASNLFELFNKSTNETSPQKTTFLFFEYLFESGQPIQVQTKHKLYENMILISNAERVTEQESTQFSLIFQQIVIAETQLIDAQQYFKKPSGQAADQVSETQKTGKQQGKEVKSSFATTLKNIIVG